MELNQSFPIHSISVHVDSSQALCSIFFLFSMLDNLNENDTMYKGGCLYSIFPLESKTV